MRIASSAVKIQSSALSSSCSAAPARSVTVGRGFEPERDGVQQDQRRHGPLEERRLREARGGGARRFGRVRIGQPFLHPGLLPPACVRRSNGRAGAADQGAGRSAEDDGRHAEDRADAGRATPTRARSRAPAATSRSRRAPVGCGPRRWRRRAGWRCAPRSGPRLRDRAPPPSRRSTACPPAPSPRRRRRTAATRCRRCPGMWTAAQSAKDQSIGWRVIRPMPRGSRPSARSPPTAVGFGAVTEADEQHEGEQHHQRQHPAQPLRRGPEKASVGAAL